MDRVVTFSIKPDNLSSHAKLNQIKQYCQTSGVKFSSLMVQAIDLLYEKIKDKL